MSSDGPYYLDCAALANMSQYGYGAQPSLPRIRFKRLKNQAFVTIAPIDSMRSADN
jgi:hypothetical protein